MKLIRRDQIIPRSPQRRTRDLPVDALALEHDLRARIDGEVRFDPGSKAMYAVDASNYRQVPIGVVIPRHVEDVIDTVEICRKHGAPILSRGGGTSLAGQCCNVAVVMDWSKYVNQVLEINPHERWARVQPGCVLDHLQDRVKPYRLACGPDPATHNHCTLGGMIGNNSCGVHAQMAGRMEFNVEELDILTYDGTRMRVGQTSEEELAKIIAEGGRRGEIYAKLRELRDRYADEIQSRFPRIPRRVSGYNLPELMPEKGFHVARALVGTESTCVTILEAKIRLVDRRPERVIVLVGYDSIYEAGDSIPDVLELEPVGLEGIDERLIDNVVRKGGQHEEFLGYMPKGCGWLLVEFGADDRAESLRKAHELVERMKGHATRIVDSDADQERVWKVRESGLGATARVPGEPLTWEGWEDSAVPPEKVGAYLRDLNKLYQEFEYSGALYGHFGQGCIHTRINFDLRTSEGIAKYRRFVERAADLVVSYGGSLSGEHGDGQSRAELLPKMFGDKIVRAFQEFKAIWDPDWKMNPGKVVRPYRLDENLRLGTDYNPAQPATFFQYPDEKGNFADATLRCVGVGKCRQIGGGTMCPSYMVTREEKHSTRGRAHLLHDMLVGDVIRDGWQSEAVKEALDLCLACKGCKGECPVNVDMATYKAEFLAHYYERKLRPRHAYAFGLVDQWSRLASRIPRLANFVTQTPGLSALAKLAAGMPQERHIPPFAPLPFRRWWQLRTPVQNLNGGSKKRVILWPDTFNNYFHPETAIAAVEVLEAAGCEVIVPTQHLCCGRPLYDFGMLDRAKRYLVQVLDALRPEIQAGTPLVALEPSCLSTFKEELVNLLAFDDDAERLAKQSHLFSDFLLKETPDFQPPKLYRDAVVHGHCHHKSLWKMKTETELLQKLGLQVQEPESGCCGMAGSFGFEKDKYEVSQAVGERVLLPAVRDARRDALIIANGFSCRTQIAQNSERSALHVAQVVQMALRDGPRGPSGNYPERAYLEQPEPPPLSRGKKLALVVAGAVVLAGGVWLTRRRVRAWRS